MADHVTNGEAVEQSEPEDRPRPVRVPSSSSRPPKGILKTPQPAADGSDKPHLAWDEANLVLNEGQRDSTMKITEPKTPFVRYNPETDEVMNLDTIPGFELGQAENVQELRSPASSSGPSSRHSSFSASSRPSNSRRSSSASSGEGKRVDIVLDENAQHGGIDPDKDEDDLANMNPEERERHRKFSDKRKNHYGNEAEAMKNARALMAREDADDSALLDDDDEDETSVRVNGVRVPPLPNGTTH